jgi:hypothetical protein
MKTPGLGLALALAAAGAAWASYQFYYTDSLTTINPSNWAVNASPTATSTGLTGPGLELLHAGHLFGERAPVARR